jgi:hypothetical protein
MYEETAEQAVERRRARAVNRLAETVRILAMDRHVASLRAGSETHDDDFDRCPESACENARNAAEDLS